MSWPTAPALLAPLAPWFEGGRRDLPWRAKDLNELHPDPYAVLVSELMLQQTQVATVIPYFLRWMERFPNPKALAVAQEDEVHRAWEGLGYYRRARFLKASSEIIAAQGWPLDFEGLKALPGLGPYTAAAVAAIAFQWPEPALDGNAFRVLARLLGLEGDPARQAAELRNWLRPVLRNLGPSRLTQALMELGATCCLPRNPTCVTCPVAQACAARLQRTQERIPPPKARTAPKETALYLVALEHQGRWLLRPPTASGLLAGLWGWPAVDLQAGAAEAALPYAMEAFSYPEWVQVYTHRRERITPLRVNTETSVSAPNGLQWVSAEALASLPMGRRDRRMADLLQTKARPAAGIPVGVMDWLKTGC